MQRNFWLRKIISVDALIIGVSTLALVGSLYYLFRDDEFLGVDHSTLTTIGRVKSSQNDVRRRIQSGLMWAPLQTKTYVFEGDSIFTGEDSEATIELVGGGQLQVDPRSLIVVKRDGGGYRLDLKYGSLTGKVNAEQPLVLLQNGQLQELSSNDAVIHIERTSPEKETRVKVMSGEAKVINKAGQKKERKVSSSAPSASAKSPSSEKLIKKNEVIEFRPATEPVVKTATVELIAPENGKSFWLPPGRQVKFEWKITGGSATTSQLFEVASDPTFTKILVQSETKGSSHAVEFERLPHGSVYWRVKPSDKNSTASSARFSLFADLPPQPVSPEDLQTFNFNEKSGETGKQIMLTWQDTNGSSEFEFELARDEKFDRIVQIGKVKSTNERTQALTKGEYFWHVRGLHDERKNSPWSGVRRFKVEPALIAPALPVLATKVLNYEIPETVLKKAPSAVSVDGRGVAPEKLELLKWERAEGADSYEVEFSPNPTFANAIKTNAGNETFFQLQEVKPGSTYFRVRAKAKNGLESQPSEVGYLNVHLPAPKMDPIPKQTTTYKSPEELEQGQHTFQLKWSKLPFAETYELQWGADPTFVKSKKFRLTSTERAVKVTRPGEYAAKVRALGPRGEALSPYSPVTIASFQKDLIAAPIPSPTPLPLPKATPIPLAEVKPVVKKPASVESKSIGNGPKLLEPVRNTSFVALEGSVPYVNMRWKSVGGATGYELEFAEDADFTKVVKKISSKSNAFTLKEELPEGRVFWRVRSLKGKRTSDWSDVFDIRVLYQ